MEKIVFHSPQELSKQQSIGRRVLNAVATRGRSEATYKEGQVPDAPGFDHATVQHFVDNLTVRGEVVSAHMLQGAFNSLIDQVNTLEQRLKQDQPFEEG